MFKKGRLSGGAIVSRLCVMFSFLLVAWVNANFLGWSFYSDGAYVLDTAWYASLVHENGIIIKNPLVVSGENPLAIHYYQTHFSPGLFVFSIPSHIFPIPFILNAQLFFGGVYGALAGVTCWVTFFALSGVGLWSRAGLSFAFAVSLALAGPTLAAISYPHFEFLYVPLATLFLIALMRAQRGLSAVFLVALAAMREDFGLHLFGLLAVLATYVLFIERDWNGFKRYASWGGAAAFMAIAALVLQKSVFAGDNAFERIYSGSPPFAHLSLQFFFERTRFLILQRSDLAIVMAMPVILALVYKRLSYAVGSVAVLPWIIFNLTAKSAAAGTLSLYYAFPVMLAAAWPILDNIRVSLAAAPRPVPQISPVVLGVLFSIASTVAYAIQNSGSFTAILRGMTTTVSVETKTSVAQMAGWLDKEGLRSENLMLDTSVASLVPWATLPSQVFKLSTGPYAPSARDKEPDLVVFYATGIDAASVLSFLTLKALQVTGRLQNSTILLAAKDEAALSRLRLPIERTSAYLAVMRLGGAGARQPDGSVVVQAGGLGVYGPYMSVDAGRYEVSYKVHFPPGPCDEVSSRIELATIKRFGDGTVESNPFAKGEISAQPSGCAGLFTQAFAISPGAGTVILEFPIWNRGQLPFKVVDLRVRIIN